MYVLRVESSLLQRYFCNIADCDRQGNLIASQGFLGFLSGERREFWLQLPLMRIYGKGWVSWDHISLARAWRITSYTLHWNNSQGTYCTYGTQCRPHLPGCLPLTSWSPPHLMRGSSNRISRIWGSFYKSREFDLRSSDGIIFFWGGSSLEQQHDLDLPSQKAPNR